MIITKIVILLKHYTIFQDKLSEQKQNRIKDTAKIFADELY